MKQAFTLVELLIVIALIAILAVAVLATINPIEQTNKARDASVKNDAAEVLNAYERYYASQNAYPWNLTVGTSYASDWVGSIGSTMTQFGVLGAGDTGELIKTSELKSAFVAKKPFVVSSLPEDMMYTVHTATDNYVCYFPKANANRTGTVGKGLKCLSGVGANAVLYDIGDNGGACVALPTNAWTYVIGATNANLLCVPEGNVN